jgi:hypothetical protein
MEPALSTALLERFERQLDAVDAPALRGARPGLAVDQIRELLLGFPGTLPTEAELWWSWRGWDETGDLLPDTKYLPLQEAIAEYRMRRQFAIEEAASPQTPDVSPDDWWPPLWLPVFVVDGGMVLVMDVAASDGDSAPIHRIDWQGFGGSGFDCLMAPSLGRYIGDLVDAIDAGHYIYNADHDFWAEASAA